MTDTEHLKKQIEDFKLENEIRLKKADLEWQMLNEMLSMTNDFLEKGIQQMAEENQKRDEKRQRRKVKGRLLSHEFEDLDLEDWK